MLKISKKLALLAVLGVAISSNGANAYMKYAAVYHNPETNKIIRLGGDVHGMYLPGGDKYDIQSHENIKNALKATNFKPFWIGETHHKALFDMQIKMEFNSEKIDTLSALTLMHHSKKETYKKRATIIKKQPNLFSQKNFMVPIDETVKNFSPIVVDLRESFINIFMNAFLIPMHAGGQEIINDFFENISSQDREKIKPVIDEMIIFINRSAKPSATPFYESGLGGYLCNYFKYDFTEYKKKCLQEFQKKIHSQTIKFLRVQALKTLLDKAGNQLLTSEILLKNTKNSEMLKILKEAYHDLIKKLVIAKDSLFMQFIEGASLETLDQTKLEGEITNFMDGAFLNLPDFGFFAQIAKLSAFTNNTVLYAGDGHIIGVEKLLKKAGFECIWSKHNTKLGESLSQEDCEKFFSVQPEKKVETNVEEQFFVKSKL